MKVKLFKDKKGVSPVIGVILMVAITVILAAVIASFVFGMGSKVKSAPQIGFMLEDAADALDNGGNDDILDVMVYGSEPVKCDELQLVLVDLSASQSYTLTWNDTAQRYEGANLRTDQITDRILNAGDSFTIEEAGTNVFSASVTLEFKVIHTPTGTIVYDSKIEVS